MFAGLRLISRFIAMRRIHQVVIVVLAAISFLGFLLYKHEYDRLKNILQVLHTFGFSSQNECNSKTKSRWVPISFPSSWQQIEDIDVYSAFWEENSVKLIGLMPVSISHEIITSSQCLTWYEAEPPLQNYELGNLKIEPFTSKHILSDGYWKVVLLTCHPSVDRGIIPYGVSLLLTNGAALDVSNTPIIKVNNLLSPSPPTGVQSDDNMVAICAPIRSPEVNEGLIVQFIKFHSYFGVNNIVLYDLGTAPSIQRHLHKLAHELQQQNLQILLWNFPVKATDSKSKLSTSLMKLDCLKRHSAFNYVLISDIDQLLVPRYHSHFKNLLKDEDDAQIGRMQFVEHNFCMEFDNNAYTNMIKSFWPMFLKTNYVVLDSSAAKENQILVLKPKAVKVFDTKGVPVMNTDFKVKTINEDIAVVHTYRNCKSHTVARPKYDSIMIKRFLDQIH